jgi:hypothetical protein
MEYDISSQLETRTATLCSSGLANFSSYESVFMPHPPLSCTFVHTVEVLGPINRRGGSNILFTPVPELMQTLENGPLNREFPPSKPWVLVIMKPRSGPPPASASVLSGLRHETVTGQRLGLQADGNDRLNGQCYNVL